jgi:hypothetical protein
MNKHSLYSVLNNVFVLLLIAVVTVSCSNSASSEEETHPEPTGFVLYLNGDLIVEKYSGQDLINNFPSIEEGDETALINVLFIDEDGNEFIPDEPEVYLNFEISDTNIIDTEQHDGELWEFHVLGLQAGTATLTLQLMHDNHPDFESPAISIEVVEPTAAKNSVTN